MHVWVGPDIPAVLAGQVFPEVLHDPVGSSHVEVGEGLMRTPYIKEGSQEAKCPPQHIAYEHT